jgi:hypothetical protein
VNEPDASPGAPMASADRLTAASARSDGALRAIEKCGSQGLLSPGDVQELNEAFRLRVQPLLESASILQRTADLVRRLVDATARIRRGRPVVGPAAPVPAERVARS